MSKEAPAARHIEEAEPKVDTENLRENCSWSNVKLGSRKKHMASWKEDPAELHRVSTKHEPVENTAQNLPDEPSAPATAPLKKPRLKELIKLFAEALREYDLVEDIELGVGRDSSQDGRQSFDDHDENPNTNKDISKLWREAKPMELETVSVDPQAQLEFHEQCSSVDDLYRLFIIKFYPSGENKEIPWIEIHSCLLRWWLPLSELQKARLYLSEELEDSDFDEIGPFIQGQIKMWGPPTDLQVMICCCWAEDGGQNRIGHILKHCYRLGVLIQPLETSTMEYLYQVSVILSCLFILNDISHKGLIDELGSFERSYYGTSLLDIIGTIDKIWLGRTPPEIFGLKIESIFAMVHPEMLAR